MALVLVPAVTAALPPEDRVKKAAAMRLGGDRAQELKPPASKPAAPKAAAPKKAAPKAPGATVKKGDSLSRIAKKLLGDASRWKEIYALNKDVIGKNPDLIKPGMKLKLPGDAQAPKAPTEVKPQQPGDRAQEQQKQQADAPKTDKAPAGDYREELKKITAQTREERAKIYETFKQQIASAPPGAKAKLYQARSQQLQALRAKSQAAKDAVRPKATTAAVGDTLRFDDQTEATILDVIERDGSPFLRVGDDEEYPAWLLNEVGVEDEDDDPEDDEHVDKPALALAAVGMPATVAAPDDHWPAPLAMPDEWLTPPTHMAEAAGRGEPTHMVVQDDGRVYGHVASFTVPLTRSDGSKFWLPRDLDLNATMQGHHQTASGQVAAVGMLMTDRSHTDINLPLDIARDKFGHVGNQFAQVRFGYDKVGLWAAGALTPGTPARSVVAARGGSLSGEWFPVLDDRGNWAGKYEFLGAQVVNFPGLSLNQPADRSRYGIAATHPGAFLAGLADDGYASGMSGVTAAKIPAGATVHMDDGTVYTVTRDIDVPDDAVDGGDPASVQQQNLPPGAAGAADVTNQGDMAAPGSTDQTMAMLTAIGDGLASLGDMMQQLLDRAPAPAAAAASVLSPEDQAAVDEAEALLNA